MCRPAFFQCATLLFALLSFSTNATANKSDLELVALALDHFYSRSDTSVYTDAKRILIEPYTRAIKPERAELELTLRGTNNNCKGLLHFKDDFARRNNIPTPVGALVRNDDRWFVTELPASERQGRFFEKPPTRTNLTLMLPAYSKDASIAILKFSFTWSMHGAFAVYGFKKEGANWTITCSDLVHFL